MFPGLHCPLWPLLPAKGWVGSEGSEGAQCFLAGGALFPHDQLLK